MLLNYMSKFYHLWSKDVEMTALFRVGVRWRSGRASDSRPIGRGSIPTSAVLCHLSKETFNPPKSTGNTQEAMAPSRHD